jgi:hypothetical protein
MIDSDFWRAISLAASRTKGLPSWTSGGINVSSNFEGPKQEDRLMVPFRVDISRVRTSVRGSGLNWIGKVRIEGMVYECTTEISAEAAMLQVIGNNCLGWNTTIQPHPWKRADGSHIKAEWEE